MRKTKIKIDVWCSKEQSDYLFDSYREIISDIQLYKLRDEIKFYPSIKADKVHTKDTIQLFDSYSKENAFDFTFIGKVKNTFHSITKYDRVFNLYGKNYLYHTYKVLGFIRESVNAYILSNDVNFTKGTIADYKDREKEYYLSEYLDNREQLCKPNNIYKGANLLSAFLYRNLYLNKDFTKLYLSYFAICGVDNIKLLNNDKLELKIIKNTLEVFQSGKVDKNDCAKSLLSALYFYFIFKMRIHKRHAISVAKELVEKVFGNYYEYKGSEVLKNVYVKEVIGNHIVYSFDTKKEHITDENKKFLKSMIITHPRLDINRFPIQTLEPSLNNPLQLYSHTIPSELLQKI